MDNKNWMRQIGVYSMVGLTLVASIVIGTGMGLLLDRWLGTGPWLMFLFFIFGVIAGFYNIAKVLKSIQNRGSR
jgi:ATP synthase protein I